MTVEQRIVMFDAFVGMTAPSVTLQFEAEDEDGVEGHHGWVEKDR